MADPLAEGAQPDNSGGSMLALYPPPEVARALTLPGGLRKEELHLTVAYTGDAADVDPEALNAVAQNLARRNPFTAQVSGTARFTGGPTDVAVALADSPALEDLRRDALDQLPAHGIAVPREHGHTPHLTRAYIAPDAPDPAGRLAAFPVTFTTLSAVHGGNRTDYELGGDLGASPVAEIAREAFAAGYRATGAPVTPRARAAFTAAVQTACLYEDDPDVIADTVRLGLMEGTQTLTALRRAGLAARHAATVTEAWNSCVHALNGRRAISRYRAAVYLTTDTGYAGEPDPELRAAWLAAATEAASGFLRDVAGTASAGRLSEAITAAVADADTEGRATAVAVAAARNGRAVTMTSFEAIRERAGTGTGTGTGTENTAQAVTGAIITAATAELAARLASMTADGAGYTAMLEGLWDTVGGSFVAPVTDAVTGAVTTAAGAAAVDLTEVTLDLRKLTGTWADVYRRREELTADHVARVAAVWRPMIKRLKPRRLVKAWRQATLIDTPVEAAKGDPDAWRKDEARNAALGWLYAILRDTRYRDLEQVIAAALIAGLAEGKTAALAIAADQAGAAGFNWDKAYAAMTAALTGLAGDPGMADPWVEKILTGAATDITRILTSAANANLTDPQLIKAITAALTGQDIRAVSAVVDYAVGAAMARASLDLYQSEGLTLVSWLTAGDGSVCPNCQDNEDEGPYEPSEFPDCPDHYGCRCCPAPAAPLPVSAFTDFLVPTG